VAVDATYVYYVDRTNARIGRIAKSDGTVEPNFVTNLGTGVSSPATPTPYGIEVDSNHIYWADPANDVIGRAPLTGSSAPEGGFISGADDPFGVAVTDSGWDGKFLFWTQDAISAGSQIPGALDVGRALSNGDGVDQEFASDASGTAGLMAGGPNYVYWGTEMPYASGNTRIGRALLDGTDTDGAWKVFGTAAQDRRAVATYGRNLYWLNRDREAIGHVDLVTETHNGAFISGIGSGASAIAADSSGIYWSVADQIWRADTNGSNALLWATATGSQIEGLAADANYVYFTDRATAKIGRITKANPAEIMDHVSNLSSGIAAPVTPAPTGIAVDANYIYWADYANDVIGRSPIGGSSAPKGGFITGLADPIGVALAQPSPDMALDRLGIDFGERDIDGPPSAPQLITVTNSGLEPLIVGAPFLTGESAASFEISSDTCSQAAVAPGGTCSVSVAFGPSATGAKVAELTIPATNGPYGDETVSLSGEGIDPVPPRAIITSKPRKAANSNSAVFRFVSNTANSSFQCRLDGKAWSS
ncbi:MAG: choice-of-anchor D domain-containing protein, partial [bacterium]